MRQNERLFSTRIKQHSYESQGIPRIKNNLKPRGVVARRQEGEQKKAVEALEKAKEFIPIKMLEAISNPERTNTEAYIGHNYKRDRLFLHTVLLIYTVVLLRIYTPLLLRIYTPLLLQIHSGFA
jgi:hypothetical protein